MRPPLPTADEAKRFVFNEQSIRNALRELEADFQEGPKEFVMRCCFHNDSEGGKPNLYIHIRGDSKKKPVGMVHCFKCEASGDFLAFLRKYTGWGELKVLAFARKHRATEFGDGPARKVNPVRTVTEERLKKFQFRHAYCYDRGLSEETLRRYRVGYDKEDNAIIFPWFDRVGKLSAIKRRSVLDKHYLVEADEPPWHLLYGLHLVRPNRIVWVCEGEFDAMYLDQCFREAHMTNHAAIALGGKHLLRPAVLELHKKVPRAVVLALDSDDAGREASGILQRDYRGEFLFVDVTFEDGKDPNEVPLNSVVKKAKAVEQNVIEYEQRSAERYENWKGKQCAD